MLDLKFIRENPDAVKQAAADKNDKADVDGILQNDTARRELLQEAENLKQLRNKATEEIAQLKKNKQDATAQISEMKEISGKIKALDGKLSPLEAEMRQKMMSVPNMPHESVPAGGNATENVVLSEHGQTDGFSFEPLDHLALGEHLDIFDFKRGAKVAGSGFPFYKGPGARLERALINFMIDYHVENHDYVELFPPFMVNRDAAAGTGQLPKSEEQMYHCEKDDLFLIPTAEVPVTNMYRDEILRLQDLPIYHAAYSACFRREAGSWGKDTRGFLRLHQFNKAELVKFVEPDTSYEELEKLVKNATTILEKLGLRYRILSLCRGDLSFASAKTYDLEAWAPVEKNWLEVSSCSNFEDFQARRANIRYRDKDGKVRFVHTLNGSGLATSRIMVAIMETYQTEQKTLVVPEVLRPYMGGLEEITN